MKYLSIGIIAAALFLGASGIVSAQKPPPAVQVSTPPSATDVTTKPQGTLPTLSNPIYANSIADLIYKIVDIFIFLGVIVAVLMFIFVGFKFVWARGDSKAVGEARQWFYWLAIGTAILITSKVIVEVIKNTFISAGVVNEELFKKP
jgi:hypothetical protein